MKRKRMTVEDGRAMAQAWRDTAEALLEGRRQTAWSLDVLDDVYPREVPWRLRLIPEMAEYWMEAQAPTS